MGGPSAEHEISLRTGRMVLEHLDKNKYQARGIVISESGHWPTSIASIKRSFDLAFIAMHGEYGEDGQVQELLERAGIKFTGSGAAASRLGMDKAASGALFQNAGLKIPPRADKVPLVIKPSDRGSSVGVSIVKKNYEIAPAVLLAAKYSANIICQKYIQGREFTCGILETNSKAKALPPTEIIPKTNFFDYKAKYTSGASREITPPELSVSKIKEIQRTALAAHRAIGARGLSRTDVIMDKKGVFYVLEINTLPGLTKTSLLPQEAAALGIEFPRLLEIIIENALRRV